MLKTKKKKVSILLEPDLEGRLVRVRQAARLEESYSATLRRLISHGLIALELESANKQRKESPHV